MVKHSLISGWREEGRGKEEGGREEGKGGEGREGGGRVYFLYLPVGTS